jgi:3'-phosphoadenosine 5'-phosphosulfate (PAPS) 3'-phosphatase
MIDGLTSEERSQLDELIARATPVPEREWTTYPALMVASGELDVAVQFGHHWDHAAHSAVVVAAGGEVSAAPPPEPGARYAVTSSARA